MDKNEKIWGQKIRDVRQSMNLTQQDFANKIDVSTGKVAQIEQGRVMPSLEIVAKVCKVFCINANWIVNLSDERSLAEYAYSILFENICFRPSIHCQTASGDDFDLGIKQNLSECLIKMGKRKFVEIIAADDDGDDCPFDKDWLDKPKKEFLQTIEENKEVDFVYYTILKESK